MPTDSSALSQPSPNRPPTIPIPIFKRLCRKTLDRPQPSQLGRAIAKVSGWAILSFFCPDPPPFLVPDRKVPRLPSALKIQG